MPRASRYLVEVYTYHLTHRCHDRRFHLRFKAERDAYREWLRIGAERYHVPVYGYCITHTHTHVMAHADTTDGIARMMNLAASAVARQLNDRKGREGSVWEHPYQCTMIEDGPHLLHCLRYVDLNMVRAGVVRHPQAWRWCGYDELTGTRQRYRILALDRLLATLDLASPDDLARLHRAGIEDQIARGQLKRAAHWTEAVAVGSSEFLARAETQYQHRQSFSSEHIDDSVNGSTWALHEPPVAYSADLGQESSV
jgi:putative transposase